MTTAAHEHAAALLSGWQGAQTATIAAALIAVVGVAATILTASARARRDHHATLYARSLAGVADYREGPYRIRRKDGTAAHRNTITATLSDVQSSIDHSRELLRMHAPRGVADAYDRYVTAAKLEAGAQMHLAWLAPPTTADSDVNLYEPYDRTLADTYRGHAVAIMQADLARRAWAPWRSARYRRLSGKHPGAPGALMDQR